MSSCCLKFSKNTESINPRVLERNNRKKMILSKCTIYGSKKSRSIKKQEATGILCNLVLKTPLNKIPLLGGILFKNAVPLNAIINMNGMVDKFILVGDKFMPEIHLTQPGFT